MRVGLLLTLVLVLSAGTAGAIVDISAGLFGGMDVPTVNDQAESGALYGIQAKVTLLSYLALGAHYRTSSYGDVSETFFEGTDEEFISTVEGGSARSFGLDAYLGNTASIGGGVNVYLMGSVGSWKWTRDYTEDVSEIAFSFGPGVEVVLPFNVGIEGRALFQIVPTDNSGSIKSFIWFVGANYHFGSLLNK
jgi:hypothetical protein